MSNEPRYRPIPKPSATASAAQKGHWGPSPANSGANPSTPRKLAKKKGRTQALAVARAEQELLKKFQMIKRKVQWSPAGMKETSEAHPVSVHPKVTGTVLNFGSNEREKTTP